MAKSKLVKANEKIAQKSADTYEKIKKYHCKALYKSNKTDIPSFRRYARFSLHPVWPLLCFRLL